MRIRQYSIRLCRFILALACCQASYATLFITINNQRHESYHTALYGDGDLYRVSQEDYLVTPQHTSTMQIDYTLTSAHPVQRNQHRLILFKHHTAKQVESTIAPTCSIRFATKTTLHRHFLIMHAPSTHVQLIKPIQGHCQVTLDTSNPDQPEMQVVIK